MVREECTLKTVRTILSCLLVPAAAAAGTLRFASGPQRVSLVELYTSEGCSSCPPAERFVGGLRNAPGLWTAYVPISFHVDYWNGLGWPDRLSDRAWTQRQYEYGRQGAVHSIYTPCFIVDGAEWEPRGNLPRPRGSPGALTVEVDGAGRCRVRFAPQPRPGKRPANYRAHVALLAGGISSKVTGGENSGRTLTHEFAVVRAVESPMTGGAAELLLSLVPPAGAARRALAAWVTRPDELMPIQATGGWIQNGLVPDGGGVHGSETH